MLQRLAAGAATAGRRCIERRSSVLQGDASASGGRESYERRPALPRAADGVDASTLPELQPPAIGATKGGRWRCEFPPLMLPARAMVRPTVAAVLP